MTRFNLTSVLSCAALMFSAAGSTQAQATRTWVSGVGDDANPCSRTAPCKTFAGTMSKTAAGGEINCIDPGGFGTVSINKSIAIICDNTEAGVLTNGTNGISINAGATDIIYLSGLDIEGLNTSSPTGVNFIAGGALHIRNSTIRGFTNGVNFAPSAGIPELYITNSTIADNGPSGLGNGVLIAPTGAAAIVATLQGVKLLNNHTGIQASSAGTTGIVTVAIRDSDVSGNTSGAGVFAQGAAGKGPVTIVVDSSTVSQNQQGLFAYNAANAVVIVGRSVITGNGLGFYQVNGGLTQSYGDNDATGNLTLGTISPGGAHQ